MSLGGAQRSRIARLLDAVYREPDPFSTVEDFERAQHADIAALSLEELDAERLLARVRWAVLIHQRAEPPSRWLVERMVRLDRAAERLRRRTR